LRVFAEGTVIVLSILLAFGIDAWWERWGENQREREALEALADDFAAADSVLALRVLAMDSAATAAQRIVDLVGPDATAEDAASLTELIPRIIRRPTFEPPMGTLDALLGSGELRLIQNAELKAALASFPSEIEGMAKTQDFGSEVVFSMLLPFLNSQVPMLEFGLLARGESDFTANPTALVRSLEFENLAQNRLMGITFALEAAAGVGGEIAAIRELLDEELGR
jgi:hypothetical protein